VPLNQVFEAVQQRAAVLQKRPVFDGFAFVPPPLFPRDPMEAAAHVQQLVALHQYVSNLDEMLEYFTILSALIVDDKPPYLQKVRQYAVTSRQHVATLSQKGPALNHSALNALYMHGLHVGLQQPTAFTEPNFQTSFYQQEVTAVEQYDQLPVLTTDMLRTCSPGVQEVVFRRQRTADPDEEAKPQYTRAGLNATQGVAHGAAACKQGGGPVRRQTAQRCDTPRCLAGCPAAGVVVGEDAALRANRTRRGVGLHAGSPSRSGMRRGGGTPCYWTSEGTRYRAGRRRWPGPPPVPFLGREPPQGLMGERPSDDAGCSKPIASRDFSIGSRTRRRKPKAESP
jgi:hypothetical protein